MTLRDNGPLNRKQLVKLMRIPRTTLFDNLDKMLKRGEVKKTSFNNGKPGRSSVLWEAIL